VQEPLSNTRLDDEVLDEADVGGEDVAPGEAPWPGSGLRVVAAWLMAGTIFLVLGFVFLAVGERFYNPDARIPPAPAYPMEHGILDASEPVLLQLRQAMGLVSGQRDGALELVGETQRMEFPRTLGDRLFGKRREDALIFTARTYTGVEFRSLVLRQGGQPVLFAIEPPGGAQTFAGRGVYVGLPVAPDGGESPFSGLIDALSALLEDVEAEGPEALSADDYTLFGPYARGDREELSRRIEGNAVMRHLVRELESAGADVSIAAPVFLFVENPASGSILGLYQSRLRLVMEPLWGASSTSTLAHELLHAFMARAMDNPDLVLDSAATYFETAHPRLHGQVVGDRYQQLDRKGRAEETLAFIVGAVAAGQTRTVATASALQNQGLLSITEPILTSDLELLLELGLVPACMDPAARGHHEREVTFAYYESARAACG
jgi:hypothetical protein